MDVHISKLKEGDTDAIAFIQKRLVTHWNMCIDAVDSEWIHPAIEQETFPYIFIARVGQVFVGQVFLHIEADWYFDTKYQPWMSGLFVQDSFRGNGIAAQLIQVAKDAAMEQGYRYLYLDTADSRGYYDHIGSWELLGEAFWEEGNKAVTVMRSNTERS